MKTCRKCSRDLDDSCFYAHSRRGYQSDCKECRSKYNAEWYEKNSTAVKARSRASGPDLRKKRRQFVWDYLLAHPCVDCSEADPVVLEFDHVRGKKSFGLAYANNHSMEALLAEIAKCEIRCANCHRRRTAESRGWYRHVRRQGHEAGQRSPKPSTV